MSTADPSFTVRLDERRDGDLKLLARLLGLSQADVMRLALDAYAETHLSDDTVRQRLAATHRADCDRIERSLR